MPKVRINIHNCDSYIYGTVPPQIFLRLKEELSFRVQNCEFSEKYNTIDPETHQRKWDGRIYLIYQLKNCVRFSTGLLSKVRKIFDEEGLEYTFTDSRKKYEKEIPITQAKNFKLRDYQIPVVERSVKRERGVIKAATGSGKTAIAAGIMQKLGLKGTLFLAMSGDLVMQAKEEFERFLRVNGSPLKVGQVGAGVCDIQDVTVCTVQSLCTAFDVKYKKADDDDNTSNEVDETILQKKEDIRRMIMESKCIFFDEVQHAACDTVRDIMKKSLNAKYRYGLSASPWRDDGADLFIDSFFGKELADISASILIRKGYLVKPTIYFILIQTPEGTYSNYQTIYKNYVVNNVSRNKAMAELAQIHANRGETVLILVRQINHGKLLESMVPGSVFISGRMPAKKRKKVLDDLREDRLKVVIATSLFDEGIDVKRLNCLIMGSSGKSSTRALQRIGRVLRPFDGKDSATIYDFMDTAKYLHAHALARRRIYRTEDEFEIKEMKYGEWNECKNNMWESFPC